METHDQRKSLRIRDRAHRLIYSNSYHIHRTVPYYKRICTFGLSDKLPPVDNDIYLDRNQSLSDPAQTMTDDPRFGVIDTTISGIKDNVGSLQDDLLALKDDMGDLRTEMGDIGGKLDRLLNAMSIQPNSPAPPQTSGQPPAQDQSSSDAPQHGSVQADSNQRQQQGRNLQGQLHAPPLQQGRQPVLQRNNTQNTGARPQSGSAPAAPSHALPPHLSHQMSEDQFIESEMTKDQFRYPNSGKNHYINDFHVTKIISKPYMFLYRQGVHTLKQKLEARYDMTAQEYIDACLALLADTRAYDLHEFQDIMFHVRKVSRDALERPWCSVRTWSQFIWDSIESGDMCWADRDLIQDERVRLCLTAPSGMSSNGHNINNPTHRTQHTSESLCRAYNTRRATSKTVSFSYIIAHTVIRWVNRAHTP